MRNCPKCSSQDTVKSGKIKGRQRYRCKGCNITIRSHKSHTPVVRRDVNWH